MHELVLVAVLAPGLVWKNVVLVSRMTALAGDVLHEHMTGMTVRGPQSERTLGRFL